MKRVFVMLASAAVALTGTLTGMAGASATVVHASTAAARQVQGPHIPAGLHAVPACVNIKPGEAHCLALYLANPDGRLGDFKAGVGHLAIENRAPVVPMHVHGTLRVMPKGSRLPLPARGHSDVHVTPDATPFGMTSRVRRPTLS